MSTCLMLGGRNVLSVNGVKRPFHLGATPPNLGLEFRNNPIITTNSRRVNIGKLK